MSSLKEQWHSSQFVIPSKKQETDTEQTIRYMFLDFNWIKTLKVSFQDLPMAHSWKKIGRQNKKKKTWKVLDELEQWASAYAKKFNRDRSNVYKLKFKKNQLWKNRMEETWLQTTGCFYSMSNMNQWSAVAHILALREI